MPSVLVIGNDPSPITLASKFDEAYVFNQLYHLEKHSFPCPKRIVHVWNHLFARRVKQRHRYLRERCPQSETLLTTMAQMRAFAPPLRNTSLLPDTTRCFSTFNGKEDGHPWTLGFYLVAVLVQRGARPHVYGFSHVAWSGHPTKCEKQAVAEWNRQARLVYHPPKRK